MKKISLLFVGLCLLLSACGGKNEMNSAVVEEISQEADEKNPVPETTQVLPTPTLFDQNWGDRDLFTKGLLESEQNILKDFPGASEYHIDVTIPDSMEYFEGKEEIHYTNRETVSLKELFLHTYPAHSGADVEISNVQINGEAVEFSQIYENQAVNIPLETVLQPGDSLVLSLDFKLSLPQDMGGNYGLYGFFENYLVMDLFYPMMAVYDDEGWNVKPLSDWGDLTYLDTSFYLVRITAPEKLVLATSGILIENENEEKKQTAVFAAGPARDFYFAGSQKFTVSSSEINGITVNSYAAPEYASGRDFALQAAENALSAFSDRYGPYPYTEFDLIGTPMLAGGIEYPGIVALTTLYYDPNGTVAGLPNHVYLETVTAHEVGHQWFYNIIGSDQVDEPWLDEAVTQYVTSKYYEDVHSMYNADQYRESWYRFWGRVDSEETPVGLSVEDYNGDNYGPIVYGRGPLFMMELEKIASPELMDKFMYTYAMENRWHIATGETFLKTFQEVTEADPQTILSNWFYP